MTDDRLAANNLEAAYRRATLLQHASTDINKIILNATLIPHWIGDTDLFWYRRQTKAGVEFRLVNANESTNQEAFDHQLLACALSEICQQDISPDNLPITQVEIILSPSQVCFSAFGQPYCFNNDTKQCAAIEPALNPLLRERLISPDGKKYAFSRDYNIWVKNLETGEESALTSDGEEHYSYANAPALWGASLHADLEAAWSPDSRMLFTLQVDNRKVKRTPILSYVPQDGEIRPYVTEFPCGHPGDDHVEQLRLLAINVESGKQQTANYRHIPVNRSAFGLFTDGLAWWSKNSRCTYFIDTERCEKIVRVVEFDTYTGSCRILFEEASDTHIKLSLNRDDFATILPLPNSNELIWHSERSGFAHLYLYDMETGELKNAITQGEWLVRQLLHVDESRRELFFQAGGRVADTNPYFQDICRVNIDTGEVTPVMNSDHEYTVLNPRSLMSMFCSGIDPDWQPDICGVSPSSNYIVTTRSRVDETPVSLLVDRHGQVKMELETADPFGLPENWQWPEPVKLVAADGKTDIFGVVFRPSDFNSDRVYPIIDISICSPEFLGLPIGSFINAEYFGLWYLQAAALAELGFIVVTVSGRGTVYRDAKFTDFSYGSLPSVNYVEDRIAGINQLSERYPYIDLERVGVMGFNGMPTAVFGLLEHPEFYKVGVSHALNDPRLIATTYGEYFEGDGRSASDEGRPEKLVENLKGKLLLMHGLLDTMDHAAITFRLVEALQQANKDFDMLIFPNEGVSAHIGSDYAFRRTWDYFVEHLQNTKPPKEFDLS